MLGKHGSFGPLVGRSIQILAASILALFAMTPLHAQIQPLAACTGRQSAADCQARLGDHLRHHAGGHQGARQRHRPRRQPVDDRESHAPSAARRDQRGQDDHVQAGRRVQRRRDLLIRDQRWPRRPGVGDRGRERHDAGARARLQRGRRQRRRRQLRTGNNASINGAMWTAPSAAGWCSTA